MLMWNLAIWVLTKENLGCSSLKSFQIAQNLISSECVYIITFCRPSYIIMLIKFMEMDLASKLSLWRKTISLCEPFLQAKNSILSINLFCLWAYGSTQKQRCKLISKTLKSKLKKIASNYPLKRSIPLRKKGPYLLRKSLHSVWMRENTNQKNSWYGHFLFSVFLSETAEKYWTTMSTCL